MPDGAAVPLHLGGPLTPDFRPDQNLALTGGTVTFSGGLRTASGLYLTAHCTNSADWVDYNCSHPELEITGPGGTRTLDAGLPGTTWQAPMVPGRYTYTLRARMRDYGPTPDATGTIDVIRPARR